MYLKGYSPMVLYLHSKLKSVQESEYMMVYSKWHIYLEDFSFNI